MGNRIGRKNRKKTHDEDITQTTTGTKKKKKISVKQVYTIREKIGE